MIELMGSDDERVAAVACNSILDRAFGKPKMKGEQKDSFELQVANMTREERLAKMRELLEPMRRHLHELNQDQVGAGVTPIETGNRRRRRRLVARRCQWPRQCVQQRHHRKYQRQHTDRSRRQRHPDRRRGHGYSRRRR